MMKYILALASPYSRHKYVYLREHLPHSHERLLDMNSLHV